VAPRHMKAIKDVGGNLIAAMDPHDSVGILDSYFPSCRFLTEFERLDRHCEKLRREGTRIDYVVVCSPNYLHDAHCRFGLRTGADVICEKPLCINVRNVDALIDVEIEAGRKINTIMQLRLQNDVKYAKSMVAGEKNTVRIDYVTPRGYWFLSSWKSDVPKSGGLASNIGVHMFDLMAWMFGRCETVRLNDGSNDISISGHMVMEKADVYFRLSTNMLENPKRELIINGVPIDISPGFTELHTESYRQILAGNGFRPSDAREAIRITEMIRGYS
jgi:UDP-N-acetyl-2-amino-2-deoxyglucuronate dehydrogenase